MEANMRKILLVLVGAMVVGYAGYVFYARFAPSNPDRFAQCRADGISGAADIGSPFSLINQDGNRVSDFEVIDRLSLVYFGYTYCPDVCPLDTSRNAEVADTMAARGIEVKPVMITIDPARDTPAELKAFVSYLSDKMVGLTGSDAEIAAAIKAYRVYAVKSGSGEDYLMDHSTYTYLMAPGNEMLTYFNRDATPQEMADTIACFAGRL